MDHARRCEDLRYVAIAIALPAGEVIPNFRAVAIATWRHHDLFLNNPLIPFKLHEKLHRGTMCLVRNVITPRRRLARYCTGVKGGLDSCLASTTDFLLLQGSRMPPAHQVTKSCLCTAYGSLRLSSSLRPGRFLCWLRNFIGHALPDLERSICRHRFRAQSHSRISLSCQDRTIERRLILPVGHSYKCPAQIDEPHDLCRLHRLRSYCLHLSSQSEDIART